MKPLAIDLYCGLGGWTEGLLAEGYDVIGFDNEQHVYGDQQYPAQLVIQDVLTLHGSQFRNAALIVASPPCQGYSYRAMPWKRAKALPPPSNELFDVCFRIQREACEAAGHHIPLIVENVKGAQPWVGRAAWHYGSFYLWGDVPALMPTTMAPKGWGGTWFHNTETGRGNPNRDRTAVDPGRKVPMNFHEHEKTGKPGRSFQSVAVDATKNNGGSWFAIGSPGQKELGQNPVTAGQKITGYSDPRRNGGREVHLTSQRENDAGVKGNGSGAEWFDKALDERRKEATAVYNDGVKCKTGSQRLWKDRAPGCHWAALSDADPITGKERQHSVSRANSRKAASAQIAKIPLALSTWIARCYMEAL